MRPANALGMQGECARNALGTRQDCAGNAPGLDQKPPCCAANARVPGFSGFEHQPAARARERGVSLWPSPTLPVRRTSINIR